MCQALVQALGCCGEQCSSSPSLSEEAQEKKKKNI